MLSYADLIKYITNKWLQYSQQQDKIGILVCRSFL